MGDTEKDHDNSDFVYEKVTKKNRKETVPEVDPKAYTKAAPEGDVKIAPASKLVIKANDFVTPEKKKDDSSLLDINQSNLYKLLDKSKQDVIKTFFENATRL
jgi:ribosomal protein L11